eukprot:1350535-Rhodomonas_salina.1
MGGEAAISGLGFSLHGVFTLDFIAHAGGQSATTTSDVVLIAPYFEVEADEISSHTAGATLGDGELGVRIVIAGTDEVGADATDVLVTVSLATDFMPGFGQQPAQLLGSTQVTLIDGVGMIADLNLLSVGTYRLLFQSGNFTSDAPDYNIYFLNQFPFTSAAGESRPFNITPGQLFELQLVQQPGDCRIVDGVCKLSRNPALRVLDEFGNGIGEVLVVADVSLAWLVISSESRAMSSPWWSGGVAQFPNFVINGSLAAPDTLTLTFFSSFDYSMGNMSVTRNATVASNAFVVSDVASLIVDFATAVDTITAGDTLPSISVSLLASDGSAASAVSNVMLEIISGSGDVVPFLGTTESAPISGIATFDDVIPTMSGVGYMLRASYLGVQGNSSLFEVSSSTPTQLRVGELYFESIEVGQWFSMTVQVLDVFGNVAVNQASEIRIRPGPGVNGLRLLDLDCNRTICSVQDDGTGQVVIEDLSVAIPIEDAFLLFSAAFSGQSASSPVFTVVAGRPVRLLPSVDFQPVQAGRTLPPITVVATDLLGNRVVKRETGLARGGTLSYIDLAASAVDEDGYYNGMRIRLTAGSGAGQAVVVLDYTVANGLRRAFANFATAPSATTRYELTFIVEAIVRPSYQADPVLRAGGLVMSDASTLIEGLQGTQEVELTQSEAVFNDLVFYKAGNYSITFHIETTSVQVTIGPIRISAAPAVSLIIDETSWAGPSVQAGTILSSKLIAYDQYFNFVPNLIVTLTLIGSRYTPFTWLPPKPFFSGMMEVSTDEGGTALFSDFRILSSGAQYLLSFEAPVGNTTLINQTLPFSVTAGAARRLSVAQRFLSYQINAANQGRLGVPSTGGTYVVNAAVLDIFNNSVPSDIFVTLEQAGESCAACIPSSSCSVVLQGTNMSTSTVSAAAVFRNLIIPVNGDAFAVTFHSADPCTTTNADALTWTSAQFNVLLGAAYKMAVFENGSPECECTANSPDGGECGAVTGGICGIAGSTLFMQPEVQVQDFLGNRITSIEDTFIEARIPTELGGTDGLLRGTVEQMAVGGTVTFTDLRIDIVAASALGYAIQFVVTAGQELDSATTFRFQIAPLASSQLRFRFQIAPQSQWFVYSVLGESFSPLVSGFSVAAVDQFGNIDPFDNRRVYATIENGEPSDARLAGTVSLTFTNGIALFNNLRVNVDRTVPSMRIRFCVSSPLSCPESILSNEFGLIAIGGLEITAMTTVVPAGEILDNPNPAVQIVDENNNFIKAEILIRATAQGRRIGGDATELTSEGAATFDNLILFVAGSYSLGFVIQGFPATYFSQPVLVLPSIASQTCMPIGSCIVRVNEEPNGGVPVVAGEWFRSIVSVSDEFNNPLTHGNVTVTVLRQDDTVQDAVNYELSEINPLDGTIRIVMQLNQSCDRVSCGEFESEAYVLEIRRGSNTTRTQPFEVMPRLRPAAFNCTMGDEVDAGEAIDPMPFLFLQDRYGNLASRDQGIWLWNVTYSGSGCFQCGEDVSCGTSCADFGVPENGRLELPLSAPNVAGEEGSFVVDLKNWDFVETRQFTYTCTMSFQILAGHAVSIIVVDQTSLQSNVVAGRPFSIRAGVVDAYSNPVTEGCMAASVLGISSAIKCQGCGTPIQYAENSDVVEISLSITEASMGGEFSVKLDYLEECDIDQPSITASTDPFFVAPDGISDFEMVPFMAQDEPAGKIMSAELMAVDAYDNRVVRSVRAVFSAQWVRGSSSLGCALNEAVGCTYEGVIAGGMATVSVRTPTETMSGVHLELSIAANDVEFVVSSESMNVIAGPPARLDVTTWVSDVFLFEPFEETMSVRVSDAFNNAVAQGTDVHIKLGPWPEAGSRGCEDIVITNGVVATSPDGIARFANVVLNGVRSTRCEMWFQAGSRRQVMPEPFVIRYNATSFDVRIQWNTQNGAVVYAGEPFGGTVELVDSAGHHIDISAFQLQAELSHNWNPAPDASPLGTWGMQGANFPDNVFRFSNWGLTKAGGGWIIQFYVCDSRAFECSPKSSFVDIGSPGSWGQFNVTHGPPTSLMVMDHPTDSRENYMLWGEHGPVTVGFSDDYDNRAYCHGDVNATFVVPGCEELWDIIANNGLWMSARLRSSHSEWLQMHGTTMLPVDSSLAVHWDNVSIPDVGFDLELYFETSVETSPPKTFSGFTNPFDILPAIVLEVSVQPSAMNNAGSVFRMQPALKVVDFRGTIMREVEVNVVASLCYPCPCPCLTHEIDGSKDLGECDAPGRPWSIFPGQASVCLSEAPAIVSNFAAAVDGSVQFSGLRAAYAQPVFRMVFSVEGSPEVNTTSAELAVNPCVPDTLTVAPSERNPIIIDTGESFCDGNPCVVEVRDRYGNLVTDEELEVTAALEVVEGTEVAGLSSSPRCRCTGRNSIASVGAVGTPSQHQGNWTLFDTEYGRSCGRWDSAGSNCASLWPDCDAGLWCCRSWCYVESSCPGARPDPLVPGLFYSYDACSNDPTALNLCHWPEMGSCTDRQLQPEQLVFKDGDLQGTPKRLTEGGKAIFADLYTAVPGKYSLVFRARFGPKILFHRTLDFGVTPLYVRRMEVVREPGSTTSFGAALVSQPVIALKDEFNNL